MACGVWRVACNFRTGANLLPRVSFRERKMEQEIEMLRSQLLESEGENKRLRKRLQEAETRSRQLVRDMETRYLDCRSDLWRLSLSASKPSPTPPVPPIESAIINESIDFEEFQKMFSYLGVGDGVEKDEEK